MWYKDKNTFGMCSAQYFTSLGKVYGYNKIVGNVRYPPNPMLKYFRQK